MQPVQWLVLDDDEPKTVCTMGQEYYHWPELAGRGSLTQKFRRALEMDLVKGDAIVVAENDDFYAPDWIEWCAEQLVTRDLVGEGRALYYNVRERFWFEHSNLQHASLCQTAIHRRAFPELLKQCQDTLCPFLDVRLWRAIRQNKQVFDPYRPGNKRRLVGIKGMPGRVGYGGGHGARDRSAVDDHSLTKLRGLIGETDAAAYEPFFNPSPKPLPTEKNLHIQQQPLRKMITKSEAGRVHGPNWINWLGHLRGQPGVVGLEIGTFEGDSAEFLCDNVFTHPDSQYHCVDPFTGSVEHHVGGFNVSKLEETARLKLARFPNIEIHKGYSQDVLRTLPKNAFDFIYVDGSHTTRDVLRDGVLAFDLLKIGGTIIFDDVKWAVFPNELDRPKLGIDSFVRCYSGKIELLKPHGGWQLALRKTKE